MIHNYIRMLTYKEKEIPHFEWVANNKCVAGFSTRLGGVSSGVYESMNVGLHSKDEREHILENRKRFFDAVAPQFSIKNLHQIHSADIVEVTDSFVNDTEADGFFTTKKGVLLTISIADCGSVLFHDDDFSIVAGLHCGWRGTRDGIIQNMVEILSDYVSIEKITAYIGPMIAQESYEVGAEFLDYFPKDFFTTKKDSLHFDLNGCVATTLQQCGIKKIHNANLDTYANRDLFFSYRRDGPTGRLCSYIGIK